MPDESSMKPTLEDLHSLADGELSAAASQDVIRDLSADAELTAEYQRILRIKQFVAEHSETYASEEVWQISVKRLAEIDRTRRVDSFVTRNAWGLCAVIFASLVVGGLMQRNSASNVSGNEVARMMSSFTPDRSSTSFTPDQRKYVQGLFNQADKSVNSIRLERFLEGSNDDGRRMRRYFLRDGEGRLVLDVVEGVRSIEGMTVHGADPRYKSGSMGQATTLAWVKDGSALLLTAERDPASLVDIAKKICPGDE